MTGARDVIAGLARAGKGYNEIYIKKWTLLLGTRLFRKRLYAIVKKVKAGVAISDQRHLNRKNTV
jgi:hypothetical protein